MNDKRAKYLRKLAREVAARTGLPFVAYQFNSRTKVIRVDPKTARGLYLTFKKVRATIG